MLYAVLKAIHLLAVAVWVGGMVIAHFFLRPSLTVLEPPQRLALMHAVLGRFFRAVLAASLLALGTGLWMTGRVAKQVVQAGGSFQWPLDWLVMTAVGVLMVAIFGHIRFVLWRRFDRAMVARDAAPAGAALAAIRQWVSVNLALGVALVVFVLVV